MRSIDALDHLKCGFPLGGTGRQGQTSADDKAISVPALTRVQDSRLALRYSNSFGTGAHRGRSSSDAFDYCASFPYSWRFGT